MIIASSEKVPLEKCPALVLNADFRPLSYYPLSLWCWQDAIKSVFLNRVSIVSSYERKVRSPSFEMSLPSVIALKSYIKPISNPKVGYKKEILNYKKNHSLKILKIIKGKDKPTKAIFEGANIVKKHTKQSATQKGGIESIEMPMHLCKLSLIDPKTTKASRVGFKFLKDGKKVRFFKKSGETLN